MELFCSKIIPTINRPASFRAVYSVLDQVVTSTDFEVIVVNDSGQPLPDIGWKHSSRVKVIDTNRLESSVARNTGAAIEKGGNLHFPDYENYLLPEELNELLEVAKYSITVWILGAMHCLDNQGN